MHMEMYISIVMRSKYFGTHARDANHLTAIQTLNMVNVYAFAYLCLHVCVCYWENVCACVCLLYLMSCDHGHELLICCRWPRHVSRFHHIAKQEKEHTHNKQAQILIHSHKNKTKINAIEHNAQSIVIVFRPHCSPEFNTLIHRFCVRRPIFRVHFVLLLAATQYLKCSSRHRSTELGDGPMAASRSAL